MDKCILFLLALAVMLLGGRGRAAAESELHHLTHDGVARSYHLVVPESYDPARPIRLMVALHPVASSGLGMQAMSALDSRSEDYIVVYPNSLQKSWDDGRSGLEGLPLISQPPVDDRGFIRALIAALRQDYNISGVYLVGMDSGGQLANMLACQTPEDFAAVAVVGALLWEYQLELCPPSASAPVKLVNFVGSHDPFYPVLGREVGRDEKITRTLSVDDTLRFWAARNGCDFEAADIITQERGGSYSICDEAAERLAVYMVVRGGHHWLRMGEAAGYQINQVGIDYSEMILKFFAGDDDWMTLEEGEFRGFFGGTARGYRYYVPSSYDPQGEPLPVVMALHGRPDSGVGFAYISDLNPVAEREGFIALYPDGVQQGWNYTEGLPGYITSDAPDIAFLATLLDDLALELNIDRSRVYVMGFSNGGFMALRLACSTQNEFAAYAVIGATLPLEFVSLCNPNPVPMLHMHGTQDISIPWQGVVRDGVRHSLSFEQTVNFWIGHNGCPPQELISRVLPTEEEAAISRVVHYEFAGCSPGGALDVWVIDGGGHNLPGVPGIIPDYIAGTVNMDIHSSEVIWNFFQDFQLPDSAAG